MEMYICFCLILAFLVRIKICDFAKTALECEHHDMGYKYVVVSIKPCLINLFVLVSKHVSGLPKCDL